MLTHPAWLKRLEGNGCGTEASGLRLLLRIKTGSIEIRVSGDGEDTPASGEADGVGVTAGVGEGCCAAHDEVLSRDLRKSVCELVGVLVVVTVVMVV